MKWLKIVLHVLAFVICSVCWYWTGRMDGRRLEIQERNNNGWVWFSKEAAAKLFGRKGWAEILEDEPRQMIPWILADEEAPVLH